MESSRQRRKTSIQHTEPGNDETRQQDDDNDENSHYNDPELYPDVSSPRPVTYPTSSSPTTAVSLSRDEKISLTYGYIVRSLRRRLWKAFQDDDKVMALRAYQATLAEFRQWLQDEDDLRSQLRAEELKRQQRAANERNKGKQGGFLTKRRSLRELESGKRNQSRSQRKVQQSDSDVDSGSLLKKCIIFEKELEQKIGGRNVAILERTMNPSEPFIADDFCSPYDDYPQQVAKDLPDPVRHAAEQQAIENERLQRQRARRPRVAFRRILRRDDANGMDDEAAPASGYFSSTDASANADGFIVDIFRTTPLHEAARLGAGDFVAFLLAQGGDPNVRNGYSRTALHMCAGGITTEELSLLRKFGKNTIGNDALHAIGTTKSLSSTSSPPPGIRALFLPEAVFRLMHSKKSTLVNKDKEKKGNDGNAHSILGRLFRSRQTKNNTSTRARSNPTSSPTSRRDPSRWEALIAERMDAALAILSWVQKDTGEGPSINTVDVNGRTALHYAAETGRSDVCMAILSNFGAMLTIVDEVGARTPCEVASSQGHKELAAQLEARALLYVDPYGLDDDLMDNMLAVGGESDPRKRLVPPFRWFQTLTPEEVTQERYERVSQLRSEMSMAVEQHGVTVKADAETTEAAKSANTESASSDSPSDESDAEIGIDIDNHPELEGLVFKDAIKTFQKLQDSHVESFLAHHKWNVTEALKSFKETGFGSFITAGIALPALPHVKDVSEKDAERTCPICYDDEVVSEDWMQLHGCEHGFCKACLVDFLKDCARDKRPVCSITCPHHECGSLISKHDVEMLLAEDQTNLKRLHEAGTQNFVAQSQDLRFCPFPGCNGIVHRTTPTRFANGRYDVSLLDYTGACCVAGPNDERIGDGCTLTYEGVEDLEYSNCHSTRQPRKAHRFCFACGEDVHWPLTCDRLAKWNEKILEEIGVVDEGNESGDFNDLAQKLWIKANTRPCPSCNVNIEKNEGCNHMVCSNPMCLYEFCWICRKDWKLHSNSTGGFFRCNIWEEDGNGDHTKIGVEDRSEADPFDATDEEGYGTAIFSAREAWRTKQETNRFIHHYTRWEAHAQSSSLERKMQGGVISRLSPVVEAAMAFNGSPTFNFDGQGLSFVHSAFTELLECRSVLRHSYAFSFLRYPTFSRTANLNAHLYGKRKEKEQFERMQAELEMLTEQMSDIVARSHLRATQVQISFLTAGAAEKRVEFTNMMFQIYKDEKKELVKYQKRKEMEERIASNSISNPSLMGDAPRASLAEMMERHQRPREERFAEVDVTRALEGFLAQFEPQRNRGNELDEAVGMWACSRCTFMNDGGRICAMCSGRR